MDPYLGSIASTFVLTFVHVHVRSQFSSTIELLAAVFTHERITSLSENLMTYVSQTPLTFLHASNSAYPMWQSLT